MKSILNTSYSIGHRLSVVVGLRTVDPDLKFEPQIGIVMDCEKVIFSVEEWNMFCRLQHTIKQYFDNGIRTHVERLPNHDVLFNTSQSKKEVVVKSSVTWNTVRFNRKHFACLMRVQICIQMHIKKLGTVDVFASHRINVIIREIVDTFKKQIQESFDLYGQCLELLSTLREPPNITPTEIEREMMLQVERCQDRQTVEMVCIYGDVITTAVQKLIYPISLDVPY